MRSSRGTRIWAVLLAVCLVVSLIPSFVTVEVEAVSGVSSLTCASFISNNIAQKYIDTMMRYHINSNSTLQNSLNNGQSIVFMFEGGSDNYWSGSAYQDVLYSTRNQAVVIVVELDSSGNAYIPFYSENCSSVPDDPDWCTYNVGNYQSTTLMDGVYSFYTWNHTGPYAAFQVNVSQGYYTPSNYPNGQVLGASGINIHTRNLNNCGGQSVGWCRSAGCQLIGSGYDTSNVFNQFMKTVGNITWNSWIDYSSNTYNTWATTGTYKGYYVLDRQLGMMGTDGSQYGDGSLIELYNSTALTNITAKSTTSRNDAGFSLDYKDQCDRYTSYCTLEVTYDGAEVRGAPCSAGTDASSTLIETLKLGDKVTAVGIYKNLYGNYWYEILTSDGGLGYVYSGNLTYIEDHISDITLTGDSTPNGHVKGEAFYVDGVIASKYNELTSVACYIYNGFEEKGEPVTGASDTPSSNSYDLEYSDVDDATWMGALEVGNYTYTLYASYANYYATDPTTLQSNTGTLILKDAFFVVIPSAVDQSSCQHTDTTYVLEESTCLTNGHSVTACSTCGRVEETRSTGGHEYGSWSTTTAPGCTTEGVSSRTCARCGDVDTQTISATGHTYSTVIHSATCQEYERIEYTCTVCGHNYSIYADELMTQWQETKPEGIDESLIESKTQYRYSDYETITSSSAAVEGYTQISKEWIKSGSSDTRYVSEWPSGFDTSHELYSKYSKGTLIGGASETETSKTVMDSTEILIGHVFYHWCYGTYTEGPINRTTSQTNDGSHTTFHAFYADLTTVDPSTLTVASDTSVTYPNASACTDSHWWYAIPVYQDSYTNYKAQYTHGRWADWTEWSDDVVVASDVRKVEERTVYRYVDAQLGDHSWSDGVCTVCGLVCEHSYEGGSCTVCGEAEPIRDYYLFGYINGVNYACEEDYTNTGIYKFEDGQLVVTFQKDSYVGIKTADNSKWYMTDGYLGESATSVLLYDSLTISEPDKLYVPGGFKITFTMIVNKDGTITLSFDRAECDHSFQDGACSICGKVCQHGQWVDGICTVCDQPCSDHVYSQNKCTICGVTKPVKDYYLFGFINGADYGCEEDYLNLGEYKFVDGKVTAVFQSDSYVAVKSGDNQDWYMTQQWLGEGVTAATLFNTKTGSNEKLYVPGGVEVTFTLIDNGNDTYLLTYVVEEVQVVKPTLTLKYPSLSFESEILYNVYYIAEDIDDVVEMGLAIFDTEKSDGTVETATDVISGFETDGSIWKVSSNGISAKNLGDTLYFKVYAVLSDGSYVYTDMKSYSAVSYANTILKRTTSSSYMKSLVVAMLNYGAEAQLYFGHNTDSLMNAGLTAEQQALVSAYDESMVDPVVAVDSTKAGSVVYDGSSYVRRAPSVSFDGAFSINYYFTTANVPDGDVKLYYWTIEDYNAATTLKPSNASGCVIMTATETENQYWGQVSGIAAKELDETVFVAGFYYYGGKAYSTGVLNYSIGKYCEGIAAKDTSAQQALAQATAVYGYYAKEYFANL